MRSPSLILLVVICGVFLLGSRDVFVTTVQAFTTSRRISSTTRSSYSLRPSPFVVDRRTRRRFAVDESSEDGDPTPPQPPRTKTTTKTSIKKGDRLGDLPTPTLLIELSLAERALSGTTTEDLDAYLSSSSASSSVLDGCVFVHARVTNTEARDRANRARGSGKSAVVGRLDASPRAHAPGGAYLGLGLSNHHVGGYYWARSMGLGASAEAHGIGVRDVAESDEGELYWTRRRENDNDDVDVVVARGDTTDTSVNSNDGKRSEWADFLVVGDAVQLVPRDAGRVLFSCDDDDDVTRSSSLRTLVGVRRAGRPLGADPIVERLWERRDVLIKDGDGSRVFSSWVPL